MASQKDYFSKTEKEMDSENFREKIKSNRNGGLEIAST